MLACKGQDNKKGQVQDCIASVPSEQFFQQHIVSLAFQYWMWGEYRQTSQGKDRTETSDAPDVGNSWGNGDVGTLVYCAEVRGVAVT